MYLRNGFLRFCLCGLRHLELIWLSRLGHLQSSPFRVIGFILAEGSQIPCKMRRETIFYILPKSLGIGTAPNQHQIVEDDGGDYLTGIVFALYIPHQFRHIPSKEIIFRFYAKKPPRKPGRKIKKLPRLLPRDSKQTKPHHKNKRFVYLNMVAWRTSKFKGDSET